jgi:hypothetical protein
MFSSKFGALGTPAKSNKDVLRNALLCVLSDFCTANVLKAHMYGRGAFWYFWFMIQNTKTSNATHSVSLWYFSLSALRSDWQSPRR